MNFTKIIDEITKKLVVSNEKTEKILKLDDIEELFKIYKSFDNSLSKEKFIEYICESNDIIENFQTQKNKEVEEYMLNNVSGGNLGLNKKIFSSLLGASILCLNSYALNTIDNSKNTKNDKKLSTNNKTIDTLKKYKKPIAITIGTPILTLLGIRAALNHIVFPGIHMDMGKVPSIEDNENLKINDKIVKNNYIQIGNLKGASYKQKSPKSEALKDKCVILFGPNLCSVIQLVHKQKAIQTFLDNGATVVAVDYRGYGYSSLPGATLRISQDTLYKDGEDIYNYVLNSLKYNSKNVISFGFSIGGSVASHVAAYASEKNKDLGGLILATPINSLYSVASDMTCKPLGAIARAVTMSPLNTEDNLSKVKNKNIPLFLCSGDENDFLSLKKTLLHEKVKTLGFENVTTHIAERCNHVDLYNMFQLDLKDFWEDKNTKHEDIEKTEFDKYINIIANKKQNLDN